jgi:hypothetical protein
VHRANDERKQQWKLQSAKQSGAMEALERQLCLHDDRIQALDAEVKALRLQVRSWQARQVGSLSPSSSSWLGAATRRVHAAWPRCPW